MSDVFWLNNPLVLLKSSQIIEIWPTKNLSLERKLNALTRLIILLTILGYFYTRKLELVVISIITLLVIVIFYRIKTKQEKNNKEGFELSQSNFFNLKGNQFTQPTKRNPLMNVLLTQIKDDPKRPEAAPAYEPSIEKEINSSIADPRLFLDLGDSISFGQSMRNFYATPSTTIPNDQASFAQFCYGNMPSCKEGNPMQCMKNNASMRPY